ncbi:glutathione-regulated potassium-efflux system protein KefB [Wenzhouxiangella sp. XN201]|uniref:monovalent cation:proton antiporter-2 (CPA2) family protein n=1 Tax=Wenzhouxiangella sp. XN201 TaxID=2710755 RepID=UPI0013C8F1A3|nr:monovalent cation:proton antiporter-2 (CPA2) family protein [Wenzhouxiangella sp. XN201]NEZ04525.1 glutathione-regulated potassium-efflux system protein KefB [Wenzhouxiangella sp. XN201]
MSMLAEVIIFLAAAVVMVPLARWSGLGAVLGFLAAGVLIGPWVLGLIDNVDTILHFSELGVVLLLFLIGLELKPSRLRVLRRIVFFVGSMQLLITTLLLWPLAAWWSGSLWIGLLIAVVLSLSSTAMGVQILAEKKQLAAPHGRQAFGILLMQDIAVIPLLAIIPLFAAGELGSEVDGSIVFGLLQAAAVIAGLILAGRFLLRPTLRAIAATGVPEVFVAMALLVVLGTAALADYAGLSMALGAFLAGVLLADSEYRHEIEAAIDPFKGLLLGLFFIAVGMSIDFGRVMASPLSILGLVGVIMSVKVLALLVVGRIAGLNRASTAALAMALPQAGEFAFILFAVAVTEGVMGSGLVDPLIVAVTISMALTPLMYVINEKLLQPWLASSEPEPEPDRIPDDHGEPRVIIAGFGRVGQIVGRNLSMLGIHFTALDNNPEHVEFVRKFGHKIFYGDANRLDVLRAAGAAEAQLFILTISDPERSIQTAQMVRRHFPELKILARARNRDHAMELMALGVDEVIRETWLSSLALARNALYALGVRKADHYVDRFVEHDEATLREQVEHRGDQERLARIERKSREQLEELFSEDRRLLREGEEGSDSRQRD